MIRHGVCRVARHGDTRMGMQCDLQFPYTINISKHQRRTLVSRLLVTPLGAVEMLLYGVYVTPWLLVHVALMFVICCNSSPTASTLNDAPATVDWDAKLRAIRGQILSKLGMSAPPRVSASIVANIDIPSGVQQLYDISRELSQRKQRIHRQQIQDEVSRYFAHRVFTVEAEELEGKSMTGLIAQCI